MTNKQQSTMKRILETKVCKVTHSLLHGVSFGIASYMIDGVVYYGLFRFVSGVRDTHALVSSESIRDIHVYLGPANTGVSLYEI